MTTVIFIDVCISYAKGQRKKLDDEIFEIILFYGPRSSLAYAAYPLFWRKNKRRLDI